MSHLLLVASQGKRLDGAAWDGDLQAGNEAHVLSSTSDLREAPDSSAATDSSKDRMAEKDGIDRQLRQMETMALQHFPDDEIARKRYLLGLYNQRLGEMRMQIERLGLQALQVREMK